VFRFGSKTEYYGKKGTVRGCHQLVGQDMPCPYGVFYICVRAEK